MLNVLFTLLMLFILFFFAVNLRAWLSLPSILILGLLLPARIASPFLPLLVSSLLALAMLARLIIILRSKRVSAEGFMLFLILSLLYPQLFPVLLLVALVSLALRVRVGLLMLFMLLPGFVLHILLGTLRIPLLHAPLLPLLFLFTLPGILALASRKAHVLVLTLGMLMITPGLSVLAYALLVHESLFMLARFLPSSILAPFSRFILYLAFLFYTALPLIFFFA